MSKTKPKLLPISVPWQISPSVPHLKLHSLPNKFSTSVTFIGHFKCDETIENSIDKAAIQLISTAPKFD